MRTLIIARHAHAVSNADDVVSGTPPGAGLSALGLEQARALGEEIAADRIGLGTCTALLRTQETLAAALGARTIPTLLVAELNEIRFGSFDGGPLGAYRQWAWSSAPDAACPGGGESRAEAAARFARGLELLLARPEDTVLAITHALPLRYVLDAAHGRAPAARVAPVAHATPFRLERTAVETAARTLREWVARPRFADTPFGG